MTILRSLIALAGLVLAGLIVRAVPSGSFGAAGAWLTSQPWGLVTLVDLYLGFLLIAPVIWWFERRALVALFWIVPLPVLGNVWAALWMVIRLPALRARLVD